MRQTRYWYEEAKNRVASMGLGYWGSLVENAERMAKSGYNLDETIGLVSRALAILKAAVPAGA